MRAARWAKSIAWLVALACVAPGCRAADRAERPPGPIRIVLRHGPDMEATLAPVLAEFQALHPGVEVVAQATSGIADVLHQFYLTALEGEAADFDVFWVDVVWMPEFARAGWIADLSDAFPPDEVVRNFLPGPASVSVIDGKTYGIPWWTDAGLLYYRTDLVPRAPRTYAELAEFARAAQRRDPSLAGYIWQGRQYEGLICNVFEAMWGHGAVTMQEGRVMLETPEAEAALAYLRRLIEMGVSPVSVTSGIEETTWQLFASGQAVFLRSWPYGWGLAQHSTLAGKVGAAPLPTLSGEPGPGALGGWQLVMGRNISPWKRPAALALIAHLTSLEAEVGRALADGWVPPRRASFDDPRVRQAMPHLRVVVENARPRPRTPYYLMISDVLQSEFSAAVAGIRAPRDALHRAQLLVDHVMNP